MRSETIARGGSLVEDRRAAESVPAKKLNSPAILFRASWDLRAASVLSLLARFSRPPPGSELSAAPRRNTDAGWTGGYTALGSATLPRGRRPSRKTKPLLSPVTSHSRKRPAKRTREGTKKTNEKRAIIRACTCRRARSSRVSRSPDAELGSTFPEALCIASSFSISSSFPESTVILVSLLISFLYRLLSPASLCFGSRGCARTCARYAHAR